MKNIYLPCTNLVSEVTNLVIEVNNLVIEVMDPRVMVNVMVFSKRLLCHCFTTYMEYQEISNDFEG